MEGRSILRVGGWLGSSALVGWWAVVWLDRWRQLGSSALVGCGVVGSSAVVWCGLWCAVLCCCGSMWFVGGSLGSIWCLYGWVCRQINVGGSLGSMSAWVGGCVHVGSSTLVRGGGCGCVRGGGCGCCLVGQVGAGLVDFPPPPLLWAVVVVVVVVVSFRSLWGMFLLLF